MTACESRPRLTKVDVTKTAGANLAADAVLISDT
jgi:hypothetical protein